jgi:hypothetical protein
MKQILEVVEEAGVDVFRSGNTYKCKCPFHEDSTPSMVIYVDTNSFFCFGCQAAGDTAKFLALMYGMPYEKAREIVQDTSIDGLYNELRRAETKCIDSNKVLLQRFLHENIRERIHSGKYNVLKILETLSKTQIEALSAEGISLTLLQIDEGCKI